MANETSPVLGNRVERILAFMVLASIGLSIISFVAVIIGRAVGVLDYSSGIWQLAAVLPGIGLPLGLLLVVALLIISGIRRGREAKDARN